MKEKIKIISDGKTAEVYIDGEKVRCTDIDLHFSGHTKQKPMIKIHATWTKLQVGIPMIDYENNKTLTEEIKINC